MNAPVEERAQQPAELAQANPRPAPQSTNASAPDPRSPPTDNELRAVAYYAIGVGSEGSIGGRDVSNRLSFAGRYDEAGRMHPVANSGFSIGTLQSDLGQRPNIPGELVAAYQNWAREHHPDWVLNDAQRRQTERDLGRTGEQIRADGGRPLNGTIKAHLDEFMKSDEGIRYVHGNDTRQVEKLMTNVMEPLQASRAYQALTPDDQIRMATIVAKAYNQSEVWGGRILDRIENGQITTVAQTSDAVGALLRGNTDYMQTGRDHAREGAEVFIKLRNASPDSPLREAYANVVADPLADPTRLNQSSNPNLREQSMVVKDLFLQKGEAPAFIQAMNTGNNYMHGQLNRQGTGFADDGLQTNGRDFVAFDRNGKGVAFTGGQWNEVDRSQIVRTVEAGNVVDLSLNRNGQTTPLLEIDPAQRNRQRSDAGEQAPAATSPAATHPIATNPAATASAPTPQTADIAPQSPSAPQATAAQQALDPLALAKLSPDQQQLFENIRGKLQGVSGLSQDNTDRLALAAVSGNADPGNPSRVTVEKVAVWNHPEEGVKVSLLNQHGEHNTFGLREAPTIQQSVQTLDRLQQQQTQQAANPVERDNVVAFGGRGV